MTLTLDQLRTEIWEALGDQSDLDPSVDSSRLDRIVNLAQQRIASWRDPQTGRIFRYHKLFGRANYKTSAITDTIASVSNSTSPYYITVDGDNVGSGDDRYNDWLLEVTSGDADGQIKVITDYDSATGNLYYEEAFGTAPSADDTVKLYKNFDLLLPSSHSWVSEHISLPATTDIYRGTGNLIEILNIYDITNKRFLDKAVRAETFSIKTGNPTKWYRFGDGIFYDCFVDTDDTWLRYEYYRMPMDLTNDADVSELPEMFHYAIVLWGIEWGLRKDLEYQKKWQTHSDFVQYMRECVSQWDMRGERAESSLRMKFDG